MNTTISVEDLECAITEMGAGKVFNRDFGAETWNNAHDRCIAILRNYMNGEGLFQIMRRMKEEAKGQA